MVHNECLGVRNTCHNTPIQQKNAKLLHGSNVVTQKQIITIVELELNKNRFVCFVICWKIHVAIITYFWASSRACDAFDSV